MMLPPPPVTGADVGTGVTVGMAVTVAVDDAVTVAVADDVTVTVGVPDGVNVTVGDGDGENVTDGVGDGLWVPDSVLACVAVPVSTIAVAPITRQPDATMMRIAISRSCSPDRSITVMSVTDRSLAINESASPHVAMPFTPLTAYTGKSPRIVLTVVPASSAGSGCRVLSVESEHVVNVPPASRRTPRLSSHERRRSCLAGSAHTAR
jgi:hypothetical protein